MQVTNRSIYSFYLKTNLPEYLILPGQTITVADATWLTDDILARGIEVLDNAKYLFVSGAPDVYPRTEEFPYEINFYGGDDVGGWTALGTTLTYSSADDPVFVATTGTNLTTVVPVGARIKLDQTTSKYFIVVAIDATTITLYGGTDYDLANAAITVPFYSLVKAPVGFPLAPDKWTVETIDAQSRSQSSPVNLTWYNIGSLQISIPIGVWRVYYDAVLGLNNTASDTAIEAYITLSTANNSESNDEFTGFVHTSDAAAAGKGVYASQHREGIVTSVAKHTRYLNAMSDSGATGLNISGDLGRTNIRAVSVYV